jgi:hypothetical protein
MRRSNNGADIFLDDLSDDFSGAFLDTFSDALLGDLGAPGDGFLSAEPSGLLESKLLIAKLPFSL